MKNIQKVFKINISTYLLLFLCLITGFIKEITVILLIIIIHELGHIIASLLLHYKIIGCELYPFGGITKVDKHLNCPIIDDFIIYISGIIFQILSIIILNIWFKPSDIFMYYNKIIILFNIIPIFPLDGFGVIKCLLEKTFSYYKAYIISIIISWSSLLIFIFLNIISNNIQIIIFIYLIYKNIIYLKEKDVLYIRFLVERLLFNFKYNGFNYIKNMNLKNIKKEKYNYLYSNNSIHSETYLIAKKFDINTSF